jgi:Skp family chaperone for outer membrane proteins
VRTEERRGFLLGGLALAGVVSGEASAAPSTRTPVEPLLGTGQEPGGSLRLGVVSLNRCLEKYDRMKEVEEEIARLKNEFAREAETLKEKIATLTDTLGHLKTLDATYAEQVKRRGHAEYDLKFNQELGRRRIRDLTLEHESRVLFEIRRVVALVARDKKLQIVLRVDEPAASADDPESAARLAAAAREMLYHEAALDITDDVKTRLNAEWASAWPCPKCQRKAAGDTCPCGAKKP